MAADEEPTAAGPLTGGRSPDLPAQACEELDLDARDARGLRELLAALAGGQVDRFDPARFRFIRALLDRVPGLPPAAGSMLEDRARRALQDYLDGYCAAQRDAADLVDRMAPGEPQRAQQMRLLLEQGDVGAVQRCAKRLSGQDGAGEDEAGAGLSELTQEILRRQDEGEAHPDPSLEDELRRQESLLLRSMAEAAPNAVQSSQGGGAPDGARELRATRNLRQELRKHQSQQSVARAIGESPANPGPLNAQALVVRSLRMMRDLSPAYADRFVSYMETLLWLEQADKATARAQKKRGGRRKP